VITMHLVVKTQIDGAPAGARGMLMTIGMAP
jgi:hypothetical protein